MKGFTLVETLLVSAIFLIVGTLLAGILVNNMGLYNTQTSLVSTGLSVNQAIGEIETYIKQASAVASGYPEVSPTYTTNNTTLVLKIPSYNAQGIIANTFDFIVITKDISKNNLLMLYVFPDGSSQRQQQTKVLSNLLQSIEFTYLDKNDSVVTPSNSARIKVVMFLLPSAGGANRSAEIVTNLRNI